MTEVREQKTEEDREQMPDERARISEVDIWNNSTFIPYILYETTNIWNSEPQNIESAG